VDICTGCSQKRVTLHLNLKSSGTDIVEEILRLSRITKNIEVECDALDCKHNNRAFDDYGFCTGELRIEKGMCAAYITDKEYQSKTLKLYLKKRVGFVLPNIPIGSKQWSEG